MKAPISDFPAQFIVDQNGKKTAVVLDIKTFESLVDQLEDFYLIAMAKDTINGDDGLVSHEEIKKMISKKK